MAAEPRLKPSPSLLPALDVAGAALLAAAAATVASLGAQALFGLPTPADLYGDRLTVLIPLPIFEMLLHLFGTNAKHLFYGGLIVAGWLVLAVVGILYWQLRERLSARRGAAQSPPRTATGRDALALVVVVYVLAALLCAPLIGGGFFGSRFVGGVGTTLLALLVPGVVFAGTFLLRLGALTSRGSVSASTSEPRSTRRALLRQGLGAVALIGGGVVAARVLTSALGSLLGASGSAPRPALQLMPQPARIVPPPQPVYGPWLVAPGITPEVTSPANFYYVSKDLAGDPTVDAGSWRLSISGAVDTPYTLSYDALRALPRVSRYHTLECISNDVGGNLMSNGLFAGVRLVDVLHRAGVRDGADVLVFTGADGYSDSLHITQALDPRSLIVYLLDGAPLPRAHGFPARLLIPGLYGMKNGKWLTGLSLESGTYTGYWEQQGWTAEARVKPTTRIDIPHSGDLLPAGDVLIGGVAYAADRGVARVDVSVDGGQTWSPATLRKPLGDLTWVLWEYRWRASVGTHTIVARLVDLQGYVQTPAEAPTLPDGASGYDAVRVSVG